MQLYKFIDYDNNNLTYRSHILWLAVACIFHMLSSFIHATLLVEKNYSLIWWQKSYSLSVVVQAGCDKGMMKMQVYLVAKLMLLIVLHITILVHSVRRLMCDSTLWSLKGRRDNKAEKEAVVNGLSPGGLRDEERKRKNNDQKCQSKAGELHCPASPVMHFSSPLAYSSCPPWFS